MATLNRREWWRQYKGKRPKPLPMPRDVGPDFEDLDIDYLDLTVRTRNALKSADLQTVGSLLRKTAKDLLKIPDVGRSRLYEIEWQLRTIGEELRSPDVPPTAAADGGSQPGSPRGILRHRGENGDGRPLEAKRAVA